MAIDLTGIINENEFYTHHYLSAILENDLKEVFGRWEMQNKEQGIRPPYDQLKALAREYFRLKEQQSKIHLVEEKCRVEVEFIAKLLGAVGYTINSTTRQLDDGRLLPITGEITKQSGAPELWIIHGFNPTGDDLDPLEITISSCHYGFQIFNENDDQKDNRLSDCAFEEVISRRIFGLSEPPRWIILCNLNQLLLIDRSKWNQKRFLRFDLNEIFGRREHSTFKAVAALLHRESVCPEDGLCLLDNLDENSHKHAFAVSEDLKYALRQSIELLGNEAVYYLQEKRKKGIFSGEEKLGAEQLTVECLRYMYRMLFLFYIEARPELGYAPMDSEEYRKGYSLESLRNLEMVPLTTEESLNGTYIYESIQLLFEIIYNGFQPRGKAIQQELGFDRTPDHNTFRITPLNSHLFDPSRTPLLNRVKFRNVVLQEIIRLMSLTRSGTSRLRRGRISYAQLGINQLGAAYEALLSYRGFFAETDLYEVKIAGEKFDELSIGYFVKAEELEKYTDDEKFDDKGKLVFHLKGKFIYRLAGRDREKSASYYTPEVLTNCLVKYALKDLLKGKTADEILLLTVCEPAMGSAAFLNEAINQLAEAYLQRKQKELGQDIPHEEYLQEKQKVKMFIADNNVFGVDLNPVAVELAEVSLWLNTIYKGGSVPWFGLQLACGNSLIGARRQVFCSSLLGKESREAPLWLDEVPERIPLCETRPVKSVYHFLLPDKGMANYTDPIIKSLAEEEIKIIDEWRKEFTKPFKNADIVQLEKLSKAVDRLWKSHVKDLSFIRQRTSDPLQIFGQPLPKNELSQTLTKYKDGVFSQELLSQNLRNSSAYRRLKLVMDYWCALWFWPIEKADLLPTREEFMFELSLLLKGDVYSSEPGVGDQLSIFPDTRPKQRSLDLSERLGLVCVDDLCQKFERFKLVQELTDKYRFLHWELIAADLFQERGGFDLVLGNPPWTRVRLEPQKLLSEYEPKIYIRKYSATKVREELVYIFQANKTACKDFIIEATNLMGTRSFMRSSDYFYSGSENTNLYKCFLEKAFSLCSISGIFGLLHDSGIYDEPKSNNLRGLLNERLIYLFRFINQLNHFPEQALGHAGEFAISILIKKPREIDFKFISSVLHPKTIDSCLSTTLSTKPIPKIKDSAGWIFDGHTSRVICYNKNTFDIIYQNIDDKDHIYSNPVLSIYAQPLMDVLIKAAKTNSLGFLYKNLKGYTIIDETSGTKLRLLVKKALRPKKLSDMIVSAPHYYVGTPLMKVPNRGCKSKGDYSNIDLEVISDEYIPRALFNLNGNKARDEILNNDEIKNHVTSYRLAWRNWVSPSNERTLITTILPPEVLHINTTMSMSFPDLKTLTIFSGLTFSIVYDYLIRVRNIDHIWRDDIVALPYPSNMSHALENAISSRALLLTCVNVSYKKLWEKCAVQNNIVWAKEKMLLGHLERRNALLEIDVLAAMALGMKLNDLKLLYATQFSTLYENEKETFYDQKGKLIFTINRGYSGVGFSRTTWNQIKDLKSGQVERTFIDDTLAGGPQERTMVYQAPFEACDREKDYEIMWKEFERRFK